MESHLCKEPIFHGLFNYLVRNNDQKTTYKRTAADNL